MFRQLYNAVRRQPVIAGLLLIALGLAIYLLVGWAKKEGLAAAAAYDCTESWATCRSATKGHCYWGDQSYNKGMCCPKPWSGKSGCSTPNYGAVNADPNNKDYSVVTRHFVKMYGGNKFEGTPYTKNLDMDIGDVDEITVPQSLNGVTGLSVHKGLRWKLCDKDLGCSKEWRTGDLDNVGTYSGGPNNDRKYDPENFPTYSNGTRNGVFNWNDQAESVKIERVS